MKYYTIVNPLSPDPIVFSEEDILADYWEYWKKQMEEIKKKHSNYKYVPITKEECIKDWVVVNWAWESTKEEILKYHKFGINTLTKLHNS